MSDELTTAYGTDELEIVDGDAAKLETLLIQSLESTCREPLYPGDERRIFAEGLLPVLVQLYTCMNDAARQTTLRYARGGVLDALGERTNTLRLPSERAVTVLRFKLSAALEESITIPAGTRATPNGDKYFATDANVNLPAGSLYVDVAATATQGGSAWNGYTAGQINVLVDLIPYIMSVENTIISTGGDDGEPYTADGDDHYRERIRLSTAKFSTAGPTGAYAYWAKTADPGIVDVSVTSPSPGKVIIYPLMEGGAIPETDVLTAIKAVMTDDVRPMTDDVDAQAPTAVSYDIVLTYYTTEANEAQVVECIEGADGAIERYKAWQCGGIGRDINPDYLRKLILAPDWENGLIGAVRVEITSPVYTVVDDTSVPQFSGTATITHSIARGYRT